MEIFEFAEKKRATSEVDEEKEMYEIYYNVSKRILRQIVDNFEYFSK